MQKKNTKTMNNEKQNSNYLPSTTNRWFQNKFIKI